MADNYWQERQAKNQSMQKSEEELNESLKKYYATESEKLSQEIASYYGKYGVDNVIEYRKLLENLSDSERQLLFEDYDAFADKYPEYADLLPVRESIYKLNRAEGLKTSILLQQLEIGAIENSELQEHFEKMASLFAESSANFLVIDKNIAKLAVGQAWFEETDFSSRIWSNRQALAKTLQSDILNGIIRGDDYKTITRNVQDRFEKVSKRDIERLVFTEDTYLANEAAMQTYVNGPDFQEYEYMIADGRACDICASLDGQKFKIDERSPGVNFPPMHPWCRCTFVPVYSGNSSEKAKYFLKSGLTSEGKNGTIGIYRKRGNQTGEDTYLTDAQFSDLTIEVRKLGAAVVRNDPQFNKRLTENGASAATYGDVLVFGENVTKSDVLEETFHYKQNLNKVNDDKPEKLRAILNEIEAKQYLLDNAKKYSIPRKETELTRKQLTSYQKQLEKYESK